MVVKIMVLFLGTLNIRGRIIRGTQKGTIILTTTQKAVKYDFHCSFAAGLASSMDASIVSFALP